MMLKRSQCCIDCSDPKHSYECIALGKPLPIPYSTPITIGVYDFEKFDISTYKPIPKSAHRIKIDKEIEVRNNRPLREKIAEYFSMQKTPERIASEKQHEQAWKASGVKSWKELFNLD